MKTGKKNIFIIIMIIFSSVFLFLSFIPNLYEASLVNQLPPNRTMIWGEHIFTYDYNTYLSKIRQGLDGRWLVVNKYDNHPNQPGVLMQEFYLLMGQSGRLFHPSPVLVFHLFRIILSFIWILTIVYLNVAILKKPVLYSLGIVLTLLSGSFPVIKQFQGKIWIEPYMNWWQEMDVIKRVSYHPHYLFNYISMAFLIWFMYKLHRDKKSASLIALAAILFVSLFVHPAAGLVFIFAWGIFQLSVFLFGEKRNSKMIVTAGVQTIILLVAAGIPILILAIQSSFPEWKVLTGNQIRPPFTYTEYILALGPVFFTGIIGLIIAYRKRNFRFIAVGTWVVGSLLGTVVAKIYPFQTEIRYIQVANHVPLAILSIYFFSTVLERYKKRLAVFAMVLIIFLTTIGFGIVHAYYSIRDQNDFITQKALAQLPLVPYPAQVMYPLTDFYNGMMWLNKNTDRSAVVLSAYTAGNYIPAYAGNFVYLGHSESPNEHERVDSLNRFFSGALDEQTAYIFLRDENISYIFYGPQEKDLNINPIERYPFLGPVFKSGYVTIFKFNKSSYEK